MLLSANSAVARSPSIHPRAALDLGRVAYERGDYKAAIDRLHPLLYPRTELGTEDEVLEAHRLLALSYFFIKKEPEAEQEITALLSLKPSFELDPVVDPPTAVSFFQSVRRKQAGRLREMERLQQEESERAKREDERQRREAHARAERVYIERQVERHSRLLAFVPFGVGQAQNHQPRKAIAIAVTEVTLGAAWAALTLAIGQRYPRGVVPRADRGVALTLVSLQIATGTAFWVVVTAGIVDALLHYVPEIVTYRELPAPPNKSKTSLAPLIAPGLYGLVVHGVF